MANLTEHQRQCRKALAMPYRGRNQTLRMLQVESATLIAEHEAQQMTDLDRAWALVEMCARMQDGNFRMHLAEEIANLFAEIRKAKGRGK